MYSRAQAEAEFIHAFTRQVGYTAGAASIKRMAGIVEHFDDANAYQFELVKRLTSVSQSPERLAEKYATDVLNFAAELGIIAKLPSSGAPHLSRFVLADAGVAIRAARAVAPDLEPLVLEHLILENDADAYLRVLWLLKSKPLAPSDELAADFLQLVFAARETRFDWLQQAFPSKPVLLRLLKSGTAKIHWLKAKQPGFVAPEKPSPDFGRHHFSPRKSWAIEMGHYDSDSKLLTDAGLRFMTFANWSDDAPERHWISPPVECLSFLRARVSSVLVGAASPTFDMMRPSGEPEEPDPGLIKAAADFLRAAFNHIRLVHARQALTSPLKYFVLKRERETGKRYDIDNLLLSLARSYSTEFSFLSSRSGTLAYYQLRKSLNG